jgi:hypothetical protein
MRRPQTWGAETKREQRQGRGESFGQVQLNPPGMGSKAAIMVLKYGTGRIATGRKISSECNARTC